MTDTLINLQNVSRFYGGIAAVSDISFSVQRGQILGFLGPNGAGKSTTMQMITGNLAPTAGQITVAGQDLLESPLLAKAALGYLPEHPPLYREMDVDEFLRFCAKLHQVPNSEVTQAVDRALQLCGLTEVSYRLIGNLSKGYQQRVGIAQAIIHLPAVVILDEPTVGLDPIQIREIRHLIRELGTEHSVILSTHILSEVQSVCNHVQIINKGRLVLNDTIAGLLTQIESNSLYVGMRQPPTTEALMAIAGVTQVVWVDTHHCRLQHTVETHPAEALVEASVTHHWQLFELTPEKRSLEQVFVELTRADDAAMAAEQLAEEAA